ncbi:MAG: VanZ family protein [Clostridia bacterium]|nr:VanZ family protein [Clostridia bacterium]
MKVNGLTTNVFVTALMLVMVFVLPWIDRRVCKRLGLNLQGGLSTHPKAETLLRLRQSLLVAIFLVYLAVMAWLVFFSRSASNDYQVHIALYEDLKHSVRIDFGILGVLKSVFTDGLTQAISHIEIISPANIAQVYLNIMLFVPMGYLLPYVFAWFRAKVAVRPIIAGFVISFLIENIQLISRRGFYDIDDLVSNTLGTVLGVLLYIAVGYVVTHPNWRKELKAYHRWKRNARSRTLYPFARRMRLSRTTIQATNEEAIWDFYVMKLGFRLKKQIVPLDSPDTYFLLEMGRSQVEIHCSNSHEILKEQTLTMTARHLKPIMKRLSMNGIDPGEIVQDQYTGLRCIHFSGPDHVRITVIES